MAIVADHLDENEIIRRIGLQVKKKRESAGYTQERLAELMECSVTTISRLENGQQCMSVQKLVKLAKILHTDVAEFFSHYKFSDTISIKGEDEQVIEILRQSSVKQKQYFIEYMKWMLDEFPYFEV